MYKKGAFESSLLNLFFTGMISLACSYGSAMVTVEPTQQIA